MQDENPWSVFLPGIMGNFLKTKCPLIGIAYFEMPA
jgi:hypothetical protein